MFDFAIFTHHLGSYAPKRFTEEATFEGASFKVCDYNDVNLNELPDAKYIILREPDSNKNIYDLRDKILNHYLSHNSYILNHKSYLQWSILDKITQAKEFINAGIPHFKSLKLPIAKYPFIAKASLGSHGSHVYKIESKDDMDNVFKNYKLEDLLFQEFQTSGFDLRVIILGGKVLGVMKRTPKEGSYLSNYSQGGGVEKYINGDLPIIESVALKTAHHFNLDYCGVDLMKGNDGVWKVLEVNRACQFQGFEKVTGINVAKKILEFCSL